MTEKAGAKTRTPELNKGNTASCTQKVNLYQSIHSPVDPILFIPRIIGNQAVQKIFKSAMIQTKFKIGQPNDIYEQEADRVAEQVMRMPTPQVQLKPT